MKYSSLTRVTPNSLCDQVLLEFAEQIFGTTGWSTKRTSVDTAVSAELMLTVRNLLNELCIAV
jgi:hypothetical protein